MTFNWPCVVPSAPPLFSSPPPVCSPGSQWLKLSTLTRPRDAWVLVRLRGEATWTESQLNGMHARRKSKKPRDELALESSNLFNPRQQSLPTVLANSHVVCQSVAECGKGKCKVWKGKSVEIVGFRFLTARHGSLRSVRSGERGDRYRTGPNDVARIFKLQR